MRRIELFRFAAGAIMGHPMRSALTSLGVVIGVAAVVMITSVGLGAQQTVTRAIAGLGANLIVVSPGGGRGGGGFVSLGAGNTISITGADAEAIQRQVEHVTAVAPLVRGGAQVQAEGANWATSIQGVTPPFMTARDLQVASGRMFDDTEARQGRKVALLGQTVATNLFGDNDPVGQRIRVGTVPFEVIGVLAPKGQGGFGQDQDDTIIAPLEAVRSRVVGRRVRGDSVQQILVQADSQDTVDQVQEDVANLLRDRHRIRQGEEDDFNVQNTTSIMQAASATTATFTILLSSVAAVSLIVGGVGIMNIMLVAVTERTREIGLRMALGAKRIDVLLQFALEAVTLSLGGGLIGLIIGAGGSFMIANLAHWSTVVPAWAAPLALGFSVMVGLVFGSYPSWRAAQLDPIEALRRE
jgi:putative ABC transport system permease protein